MNKEIIEVMREINKLQDSIDELTNKYVADCMKEEIYGEGGEGKWGMILGAKEEVRKLNKAITEMVKDIE